MSVVPLYVLHKLEVRALSLYLLHRARCYLVYEIAQDDAIPQNIFVWL